MALDIQRRVLCLVNAPSMSLRPSGSPFPPVGTLAAPCGSPGVSHLQRYYEVLRLLNYPWSSPLVSLGAGRTSMRAYSLPWAPPSAPTNPVPLLMRGTFAQSFEEIISSPGFAGDPFENMPRSQTPATPAILACNGRPDAAFQQTNAVGIRNYGRSRSSILAACFLAAYASTPGGRPPNGNARYSPARYGFDERGLAPPGSR